MIVGEPVHWEEKFVATVVIRPSLWSRVTIALRREEILDLSRVTLIVEEWDKFLQLPNSPRSVENHSKSPKIGAKTKRFGACHSSNFASKRRDIQIFRHAPKCPKTWSYYYSNLAYCSSSLPTQLESNQPST